jgi:hypothetical protein
MADGSVKPIEDVEAGEEVLAVDVLTGTTVSATVSDTMFTSVRLRNLVTIDVDTDEDGEADAQITATAGHAFWTVGHEPIRPSDRPFGAWVQASGLEEGARLQAPASQPVVVTKVQAALIETQTYNLSVTSLHNYFALAGDTPLLTHNCEPGLADEVYDSIDEAYGPKVSSGVDYNFQRMCDGPCDLSDSVIRDHTIPGIGDDAAKLAEYLAGWEGKMTHADPDNPLTGVAYDHDKGVVVVENSYMIHAYQMSYESFVNRYNAF